MSCQYINAGWSLKMCDKMSSVMPFTFNTVDLYVVALNDKPWIRAKEVCRTLEYNKKTTKIAHIVMTHVSVKNYAHKCRLSKVLAKNTLMNWSSDSRKDFT